MSSATVTTQLYRSWRSLLHSLGVSETRGAPVWASLVQAYGANGRYYHNLDHLHHVLQVAAQLAPLAADAAAVQLAAWFHDVVYDPRAADNEAQSADVAAAALQAWNLPATQIAQVRRLILATRTHETAVLDADTAVLLDADLAILGERPARYDAYAAAVRQEYAFVPVEAYRAGRTKVLKGFLERPFIYRTPPMEASYETAARVNVQREMNRLVTL